MLVGVDVASVDRVAALVRRSPRFAARVFTDQEQRDCSMREERWASTWAAKEATRKLFAAAGAAMPAFIDVEVLRSAGTPPRLRVRNSGTDIALSLSHDAGLAAAVVASDGLLRADNQDTVHDILLPARPDDGHKGTFGRVLVIAGSRGFTGAPVLTALGAARGGAGLITLCVPESIYTIVAGRVLEVMPMPIPDAGSGVLQKDGSGALADQIAKSDAVVIGPGLGTAPDTADALLSLLPTLRCPAVADADALNIVAERGFDWRSAQDVVITPHPTEMARLVRSETAVVQQDRAGVATSYARDHGVTVVLKGSGTVVAAPDGRTYVDPHHVVALATGGTGDVLAGLVGAMLAQGLDGFDAAVAAVTIHAHAGLRVQAKRGRAGGLASDVLDELPAAQEQLRRYLL
ncbi:MAG TPA: NAD(P)H-hydrate dehydratase [Candidatus Dormibacteraeota bacterium]|nr:NAD(P)H-hydrate dehydratase [Candidatus Dormibacteraeota bacterium]